MTEPRLPKEVSAGLLNSISAALQEEKVPARQRRLKTLLWATLCTAVLATPLFLMFRESLNTAWYIALGFWWLFFLVGFHFYFFPQPRLAVPGYWSPWVFAKIMILMTFLTVVEILICPSFVFLESPFNFEPFSKLTQIFMSWGGMRSCMFFCGFIFTSMGGLLTFLTVSRVIQRSSNPSLLSAAGVAYLTQIPIIGIQIWDADLRPFVLFWIFGGVLGALAMITLIKVFVKR